MLRIDEIPPHLRVLEDISPDHIQVGGIFDQADVLRHSLDDHIAGWQDQLVGAHLEPAHITCLSKVLGGGTEAGNTSILQTSCIFCGRNRIAPHLLLD